MVEIILNINDTHTSRRFALWFTQFTHGEFSLAYGKQRIAGERERQGWCNMGCWNQERFGPPLEIVRAFREAFQELEDRLSPPSLEADKPKSPTVRRSPAP